MVVVGALGAGLSAAHADSGTPHHCPIDGVGKADVYLETSDRSATLVVQGEIVPGVQSRRRTPPSSAFRTIPGVVLPRLP